MFFYICLVLISPAVLSLELEPTLFNEMSQVFEESILKHLQGEYMTFLPMMVKQNKTLNKCSELMTDKEETCRSCVVDLCPAYDLESIPFPEREDSINWQAWREVGSTLFGSPEILDKLLAMVGKKYSNRLEKLYPELFDRKANEPYDEEMEAKAVNPAAVMTVIDLTFTGMDLGLQLMDMFGGFDDMMSGITSGIGDAGNAIVGGFQDAGNAIGGWFSDIFGRKRRYVYDYYPLYAAFDNQHAERTPPPHSPTKAPHAAKTSPPHAAKTSPPHAAKTSPPHAAKTSPPHAAKTSPPHAAKTSPPHAAKTNVPNAAKSGPPHATYPSVSHAGKTRGGPASFGMFRQFEGPDLFGDDSVTCLFQCAECKHFLVGVEPNEILSRVCGTKLVKDKLSMEKFMTTFTTLLMKNDPNNGGVIKKIEYEPHNFQLCSMSYGDVYVTAELPTGLVKYRSEYRLRLQSIQTSAEEIVEELISKWGL